MKKFRLYQFSVVAFFLIALGSTSCCYARETEAEIRKRIEKIEINCLAKNPAPAGVATCEEKVLQEWNKELNKNYTTLMSRYSASEQKTLQTSQQAWIKYRDEEFKNIDNLFSHLPESTYGQAHFDAKTRIVRDRALELFNLLDMTQ